MARLLLLLALGVLAALVWRSLSRSGIRPAPTAPRSEDMVRCERCGLNLPQSDAVSERGRWYCSREHLPARPGSDG